MMFDQRLNLKRPIILPLWSIHLPLWNSLIQVFNGKYLLGVQKHLGSNSFSTKPGGKIKIQGEAKVKRKSKRENKGQVFVLQSLANKESDEVWRWCEEKSKLGDICIDPYDVARHLVDWRPKFESWRDGSDVVTAPRNPIVCFSSFSHFPNTKLVSKHTFLIHSNHDAERNITAVG